MNKIETIPIELSKEVKEHFRKVDIAMKRMSKAFAIPKKYHGFKKR